MPVISVEPSLNSCKKWWKPQIFTFACKSGCTIISEGSSTLAGEVSSYNKTIRNSTWVFGHRTQICTVVVDFCWRQKSPRIWILSGAVRVWRLSRWRKSFKRYKFVEYIIDGRVNLLVRCPIWLAKRANDWEGPVLLRRCDCSSAVYDLWLASIALICISQTCGHIFCRKNIQQREYRRGVRRLATPAVPIVGQLTAGALNRWW